MTDTLPQIGIAVAGCKNGYAVLAASPSLDRGDPTVKAALRDMRTFMRISEPRRDYYALNFTSTAKVYTAARSSVDSAGSAGAYIAVSLFVPFGVAVKDVTVLLDKMLDAYWGQYMHSMFSSPLPGKTENTATLQTILAANEDAFSRAPLLYEAGASAAGAPPAYISFTDEADVEAVMASPFRRQYFDASIVIMLPAEFFTGAKRASFATEVKLLDPAQTTPLAPVGLLHLPPGATFTVRRFGADGRLLRTLDSYSLLPDTRLSFTLGLPSGQTLPAFNGTVAQALSEGRLRRSGTSYLLEPPVVTLSAELTGLAPGARPSLFIRDERGRTYPAMGPVGNLYEWRVAAAGFPFSLYLQEGGTERLLRRDAFTPRDMDADPISVEVPRAAPAPPGSVPPLIPKGAPAQKRRTQRIIWVLTAGIVACLAVIAVILWMWLGPGVRSERVEQAPMTPHDTLTIAAPPTEAPAPQPAPAPDTTQALPKPAPAVGPE